MPQRDMHIDKPAARAERSHYRVIGKPISIERGAVIARRGRAIDQQLPVRLWDGRR